MSDNPPSSAQIGAFVSRWRAASGSERANYQLFIGELCARLACPTPDPARDDTLWCVWVFPTHVGMNRKSTPHRQEPVQRGPRAQPVLA